MGKDINYNTVTLQCYRNGKPDYFVIETVQVRPNDQANGRLFNVLKMMRNRHQLETILEILEIPHFLITPQMWQKPYKEKIKGMEYAERKRFFRLKGQELFPKVKVVGWNADAIMILHYIERSRIAQTDWLKLKCRDVGIKLW